MNITMLGTGNAMVTECYNTCFVLLAVGSNDLYKVESFAVANYMSICNHITV